MDRLLRIDNNGNIVAARDLMKAEVFRKLYAYEDTGLTPEEIEATCAALKLAQVRAGDMEAEVERLRAGASEADELVCRLIERYEFDRPSDEANPCEWCSGNNCDGCRRMTDDDDHKIRFEMADLRFMEAARAALEGGQK